MPVLPQVLRAQRIWHIHKADELSSAFLGDNAELIGVQVLVAKRKRDLLWAF
jgi:hypothetical protein